MAMSDSWASWRGAVLGGSSSAAVGVATELLANAVGPAVLWLVWPLFGAGFFYQMYRIVVGRELAGVIIGRSRPTAPPGDMLAPAMGRMGLWAASAVAIFIVAGLGRAIVEHRP